MKTRHWLASFPLLLASSGCSLFFELNANQCNVTKDCTNLGPQFADSLCVNNVCVAKSAGNAGAGGNEPTGGSGPSGGTGSSGKAGTGAVSGGGSEDAGAAGAAGVAGTGGEPVTPPECTTNGECISAHLDRPYLCIEGSCVALTSDDCPQLVPSVGTLDLLRKPAPIIVGGYANMNNANDFHDSLAVINWDLAFSEFNDQTLGGIPNKSGGAARPVLALICQSSTVADITPSLKHLTEEVHVSSILSTLSADRLLGAFNYTQDPQYGGDPVLFLSTSSADLRLANLADDGLVWHMLGDPRTLAATTAGLVTRITPAVEEARTAVSDSGPLRVTLVYADDPTMTDLFNVLTTADPDHPETLLTFNGKAAIDQPTEFRQVKIESSRTHANPVVQNAIDELKAHPPHIVIGLGTNEFAKVINGMEGYAAGQGAFKPFYLVSHLIYNTPELLTPMTTWPGLSQRLVGVNYAEAQDAKSKTLYQAYLGRLQNSYQGTLSVAGTENYYDGAYSLLYSLAAAYAARDKPAGNELRDGLQDRVFSTSKDAQSVDIGPAALGNNSVGKLSSLTYKMSLFGTMGPPNFDRTSGTRVTTTSAWCVAKPGSSYVYQADGLIYDPDTHLFSAPTTGSVPTCLQQYHYP